MSNLAYLFKLFQIVQK